MTERSLGLRHKARWRIVVVRREESQEQLHFVSRGTAHLAQPAQFHVEQEL